MYICCPKHTTKARRHIKYCEQKCKHIKNCKAYIRFTKRKDDNPNNERKEN